MNTHKSIDVDVKIIEQKLSKFTSPIEKNMFLSMFIEPDKSFNPEAVVHVKKSLSQDFFSTK